MTLDKTIKHGGKEMNSVSDEDYVEAFNQYVQHSNYPFGMKVNSVKNGVNKKAVNGVLSLLRCSDGLADEVINRVNLENKSTSLITTSLKFTYVGRLINSGRWGRLSDKTHSVVIISDDYSTWKRCVVDAVAKYLGSEPIKVISDYFVDGEYTIKM